MTRNKEQYNERMRFYMQEYRDRLKQKAKEDFHKGLLEKAELYLNRRIPEAEAKGLRIIIECIRSPVFKQKNPIEQDRLIQGALIQLDASLVEKRSEIMELFKEEIRSHDLEIENFIDATFGEVLKEAQSKLPQEEIDKRFQKATEKIAEIPVNLPFNHTLGFKNNGSE